MNLALAFASAAQRDPAKTALFWGDARFSFLDLRSQSLWVAQQLRSRFGVRRGDRVGIWLRNCPEFVPALFGILQTGAVAVPINNFLKPPEVSFILADAGIHLLIVDETMDEGFAKLAAGRPGLQALHAASFGRQDDPGAAAPSDLAEADLAVIIYTSGTTGHPKGAMLSHGNLLANVESCRIALEAVGDDRFVVLLPIFHSFMLTVGLLLPMLIGGSDCARSNRCIRPRTSCRKSSSIRPPVCRPCRNSSAPSPTRRCPAALPLRVCISGGAPLPAETLTRIHRPLPHSAPRRLRLERSQPRRFLSAHSRPVEGGFHWPAHRQRGSLHSKRRRRDSRRRAKPAKSACAAPTSC